MAGPWFVRSLAGGTADGLSWANAKLTLAAALTASSQGDTVWVADDHAETQAVAMTLTSPGSRSVPNFIYCADHTVASPGTGDLKTTATVTTTANSNITITGGFYVYGIIFSAGDGANATSFIASGTRQVFENCVLKKGGTTANVSAINFSGVSTWLFNTSVQLGNTGDALANSGTSFVLWKRTPSAIGGATLSTTMFRNNGPMTFEGVDLSALTGTLFNSPNAGQRILMMDCKLGAGVTVVATPGHPEQIVDVIRCDSGATNYTQQRYSFYATLSQETTIVRSGGASDGTTPLSWKIVATGNASWTGAFESFPIAIWNDVVGSAVTATVEIVAAGALNNGDVWMEVEYLGSTLTPQASFANSTKANNLATGTALTVSGATWASSPGAPQKMAVTFTPQMKGYLYIRVYVGKASQTLYVDPLVTLS